MSVRWSHTGRTYPSSGGAVYPHYKSIAAAELIIVEVRIRFGGNNDGKVETTSPMMVRRERGTAGYPRGCSLNVVTVDSRGQR